MVLTNPTIKQLISTFSKLRLLVVGDILLDEFHWCSVDRISPEAPVPVCKVDNTTLAAGGAGNVAANIASLNASVDLCGFYGTDNTGKKLDQVLKQANVSNKGLIKTKRCTSLKSRIIASQQHVVRVDREDTTAFKQKDYNKLFSFIEKNIHVYHAVILSDYLKGVLKPSFTQKLIQLAKQHNCMVIVDPKGNSFNKYANANYITPNFKEFCDISNTTYTSEFDIKKAAIKLLNKLNLDALVITRSEKGITIIQQNEAFNMPTKAKEVYDITGAGDTVIACLSLGLSAGLSLQHATYLANIAAGIVVGKVGTAFVTIEELQNRLYDDQI